MDLFELVCESNEIVSIYTPRKLVQDMLELVSNDF